MSRVASEPNRPLKNKRHLERIRTARDFPPISCVDLFCGIGGLTHGFVKEGLCVDAGIDLDSRYRFGYEANNDAAFIESDIESIRPKEVRDLFSPNSFKLLAGCTPCQPFSTYSQRYDQRNDDRWGLLYGFGDLVSEIQPDVVTMENVPSLALQTVFVDFVGLLRVIGYFVWFDVVDSTDYGVPQSRERLVLIASRHGAIELVAPTVRRSRTVRQAIGDLSPIEAGGRSPRDRLHVAASLSPLNLKRIRASKPGGTWRDWPSRLVAECHREKSGRTYTSVYGRMSWDEPAPTITTQCYGYGSGRFGHPQQDRAISLREAAILQGFPRRYRFLSPEAPVEFTPIGRMIGNAVPVGLARAIAKSIREHLATKTGPKRRRSMN